MFIAVDLKVVEGLAGQVARAANVNEDRILAGLVRLWHRCWTTSSDSITQTQLAGVMGGEQIAAVSAALVELGFLEANDCAPLPAWRVCGAERYLRLKEARKAGAAKTNQRRSRARLSDAPATLNHALSPNTEHRTPRVVDFVNDGAPPAPPPAPPPSDSTAGLFGWCQTQRVTVLGLVREKPPHPRAFGSWLSTAMAEVGGDVGRLKAGWERYLRDPHWAPKGCPWAGWVSQWERFVPASAPTTAPDRPCARCGEASIADVWGQYLCRECHSVWVRDDAFVGLEGDAMRAEVGRWVAATGRAP